MTKPPNILMVAPAAPPRQSPESIQVGRLLTELDARATGTLVTLAPDASGWAARDASLEQHLKNFHRHELHLPLHPLSARLLSSHRLAFLHHPDSLFWIRFLSAQVLRTLPQKPDILYSRSSPMSGALLALSLQKKLRLPWIMHLSDPWVDSPYAQASDADRAHEATCFTQAQAITLTTEAQADFYRKKYPDHAGKIFVSPNMMPAQRTTAPRSDEILSLVYAGNFYGDRSPQPLIDALVLLHANYPTIAAKMRVDVFGQAQGHCLESLHRAAHLLTYHGPVAYDVASDAQARADLVLSIEPALAHPLAATFLPSKVLDCLAAGKRLLALTPKGSETAAICAQGYGFSFAPGDTPAIVHTLAELIATLPTLRQTAAKPPPTRYQASTVAEALLAHIERLRNA